MADANLQTPGPRLRGGQRNEGYGLGHCEGALLSESNAEVQEQLGCAWCMSLSSRVAQVLESRVIYGGCLPAPSQEYLSI